MVDHEGFGGAKCHLRNHVQHLLQTHELYQIQWESRLNNAVAKCAKEFQIFDHLCRFLDHAGSNRDLW